MRLRGIYPPPRRKGRLDDDCILEICCYILDDGPPADETSAYATSYGLAYSMDAPPSKWRVRQENHRDVLAFGLTCKQFANSALDVLWSEIDGLVRLLNVLPSSNFHKVSDGKYFFSDPSPRSWARLDSYARRVRRIDFSSYTVDQMICARIRKSHKEPLFPNLHRLISGRTWGISSTMLLMAPWLFQMPLLSLPDLRHNFSFDVGLTYMGTIEIKATGFPWPLNPDDLHVRAIAPGLARCLSNVCSLDLMGLTGGFHIDDLRMLASLSSLTSLAVWFEGAGWPDLLTSPESIFPALRILKVGDTPRALLPTFFAKIGSRTLTSLTLFQPPYHESEAPVIAPVIQVVAQKWATTLRTLIFDLTDFALTAPGLAPLSMMTSLEHLGFTSHWEISLTDSELLATIGPLHNLVSLSVIGWRGLTIEALRHIANHVVHLKALDLTFYPPNDPPGPGTEYSGHTLDTLIVNATAIDGPYLRSIEATACHLHHVFPRLRTIDTSTQRSRQVRNDLAGRWERVQEYLREGCPLCSYFVPPNLSEMQ